MKLRSPFGVALLLCGSLSYAQAPAPNGLPAFEAASIKPNKTNERMYYGLRGGNLTARNITVKGLIQIAWGKRDFQIAGGPAWITSECFDIDARAERPMKATPDMLKSLLVSRFQLQVRSETREAAIYSLVIARGGPRMKLSADQTEPEKGGPKELGPGRIAGEGIPMYVIVNLLSNMLGRTVVNNTGLTGKYDVNLQPALDSLQPQAEAGDPVSQADTVNFAIIDAVEKQLGLKMESTKGPENILVIDRVEHPTPN